MLANCKNLAKQITKKKQELDVMKACFGKSLMYNIIYNATNKPPSVAILMNKCNASIAKYTTTPLMELQIGSQNYKMVLDRINKHVAGEYKTYEDILRIATLPEEFSDQLEYLDKIITENSAEVYTSLKSHLRNSNKGFRMISRSKTKRFLYYYPSHPDDSFGIMFIEA